MRTFFTLITTLFIIGFSSQLEAQNSTAKLVSFSEETTTLTNDFFGVLEWANFGSINSRSNEFTPLFLEDGMFFTSTRSTRSKKKKKEPKTKFRKTNFFFSPIDEFGQIGKATAMSGDFSNVPKFGPASVHPSGTTIFFTQQDKSANSYDGENKLIICSVQKSGKSWSKITKLSINHDDYSSVHPFVAKEGQWLFFSSDRFGGYGGMDLYASVLEDGEWSKPFNLGPDVNSEEDEWYPFFNEQGILFFASSREGGLGGLDIYMSSQYDLDDLQSWNTPQNLGQPFNSAEDDFAFVMNQGEKGGFFSSSRPGGVGREDIYFWNVTKAFENPLLEERRIAELKKEESTSSSVDNSNTTFNNIPSDIPTEFSYTTPKTPEPQFNPVEARPIPEEEIKIDIDVKKVAEPSPTAEFEQPVEFEKVVELKPEEEIHVEKNEPGPVTINPEPVISDPVPTPPSVESTPKITKAKPNNTNRSSSYSNSNRASSRPANFNYQAGQSIRLSNINLNSRNAEINDYVAAELDFVYNILNQNPAISISINSYQASKSKADINVSTVKNFLESKGISSDRLAVYIDTATPDNRKTEITILSDGSSMAFGSYAKKASNYEMNGLLGRIYHDFNQYQLNFEASQNLNEVVKALNENPNMAVELASHTDAIGNEEYNQWLSGQRAQATRDYLIQNGVSGDRVKLRAMGEKDLVVPCFAPCSEHQQRENRRTEIRIINL